MTAGVQFRWRHPAAISAIAASLALLATACGGEGGPGDGTPDGGGGTIDDAGRVRPPDARWGPDGAEPAPIAVLEIVALDLWAQPIPANEARLTVIQDGGEIDGVTHPRALVPLYQASTIDVAFDAVAHEPLALTVVYDGSEELSAVTVERAVDMEGHGVSVRHEWRDIDGVPYPVHTVYLGLRHSWFSAQGRPARRGNDLRFMMDGEEAWSAVHAELRTASSSVELATWWWQSDFELVRDAATHVYLTPAERRASTILGMFEASPAIKRVLVGQFLSMDGIVSWVTSDAELRAYGETAGDGFEFMGQANETRGLFPYVVDPVLFSERIRAIDPDGGDFDPETEIASTVPSHMVDLTSWPVGVDVQHASYHQKFVVVDQRVAFVGGMNLRPVDWDTSEHRIFDPRRMNFSATTAERLAVEREEQEPDNGPRKDYMVRLEGPLVQDVADIFHERWAYVRSGGARYSENASDFEVRRDQSEAGRIQAQLTATLPEPFWEHAIAETWFNAIRNAERFILIEDQYWRIPMLVDAVLERMAEMPGLELIVVTKPITTADPGCAWTARTHAELVRRFPGRYHLFQLRSFDTVVTWGVDETEARWADMDVHSKLLIVDDLFLSVGSANKNNRGIVYEGELNVAVLDAAWVRNARRRVLANWLGPSFAASDDPSVWLAQLREASAHNDGARAAWAREGGDISLDGRALPATYAPRGFLYGLTFVALSSCVLETVGPDQT